MASLCLFKTMIPSPSDQIESFIAINRWEQARELILADLQRLPASHWLWTRLSLTYYEQFEYKDALECSTMALKIAPRCPLALWGHAGSLTMLRQNSEAIAIYRRLARRRLNSLAYGDCGEGLAWARGLVADCNYRISHCYVKTGNMSLAVRYMERHIRLRGPGCHSIYSMRLVRKELERIKLSESA